MTHVTCRLAAMNRDRLRNPTLGNRVWATFTFLSYRIVCAECIVRVVSSRVHHYVVRRQDDGRVHLDGGRRRHVGPVELVAYHGRTRAGLVTKLAWPCPRPADITAPLFWFGVTVDDFNDACFAQVATTTTRLRPPTLPLLPHG